MPPMLDSVDGSSRRIQKTPTATFEARTGPRRTLSPAALEPPAPDTPRVEILQMSDGDLMVRTVHRGTGLELNSLTLRRNAQMLECAERGDTACYRLASRALDITLSLCLLLACSPLLLVVAACIWATDRGPVFFRQQRAGLRGEPFAMLKFRSMVRDAERLKAELLAYNESSDGVIFKIRRDPRITPIGRFIRRFSIDELPQLFNVLKGEMAIVGPRPHPVDEAAQYDEAARVRLLVKPGLTCIWQVMGRSTLPFRENVLLDRLYIEHRCMALDMRLIARTAQVVLSGHGAY